MDDGKCTSVFHLLAELKLAVHSFPCDRHYWTEHRGVVVKHSCFIFVRSGVQTYPKMFVVLLSPAKQMLE
jgi:hypothetical protein